MSRRRFSGRARTGFAISLFLLLLIRVLCPADGWAQVVGPLHKSEPNMQVHQYVLGEGAFLWPGANGLEPVTQADWNAFFAGAHHEVWDYIGVRTEYSGATLYPGTITYGGRYAGGPIIDILWSPPAAGLDLPYSEFKSSVFNTLDPFNDPLVNDDGSGVSSGNLTAGSWSASGDDLIEGAHEEDLFFIHDTFPLLYDLYGNPAFNPSSDYLQDEFYNGADLDAAEVFYHHLWRRITHNDSDLFMMGVSWSNCQSSWDECIVMPDIFGAHPSPIQIAEAYWQMAIDYYLGRNGMPQDKPLSFYLLGRVAHLLADMTTPAHAHCDPHSPLWPDSYENIMGAWYPDYTHNSLPLFDESGNVTGSEPWGYTDQTWPYADFTYVRHDIPGTKWDPTEPNDATARPKWESQSILFRLFWATAELADNYDSNDANGELDGGARRAGGFSQYELRQVADELMPQAMVSMAELLKLFSAAIAPPHISLLGPADGSAPASPPIFTWAGAGFGANSAYAVDAGFSPSFTTFWSTYENMHQLIRGESWAIPSTVWAKVPAGRQIFWRVRGADLDVTPLNIVTSDQVWSFTKQ